MKVYRVTLMVVDFDELGAEQIERVLENTRYPNHCFEGMNVVRVEERDIGEWDDNHALNQRGWEAAFAALFV